jgi:ATP synthase mitochondrial F1 complex assembly factor 1
MVFSSKSSPLFIVPVVREDLTSFNMISQIQDGKFGLMTWLEQYRSNPSTAPPYMAVVFFDDLLASKDTVLFRADIVAGDISKTSATRVIRYLRDFYVDPSKFENVKTFNHNPRNFDFENFKSKYYEFF